MKNYTNNDVKSKLAGQLLQRRRETLEKIADKTHRLQLIDTRNGVEYVDDGKTSSIKSAFESLRTVNYPVVWLVETHPHADYKKLAPILQDKVKAIVALGDGKIAMIDQLLNNLGHFMQTGSMEEAVDMASICACPGDTVLYAPAAPAEDDQAVNTRSRKFCDAVAKLI